MSTSHLPETAVTVPSRFIPTFACILEPGRRTKAAMCSSLVKTTFTGRPVALLSMVA